MRTLTVLGVAFAMALASAACGQRPGTLQASAESLGSTALKSIEYTGTGRWYQFGQAPNPTLPWPQFDVSSFTATINYDTPSARVQMTRKQTVEPGRVRPAPVEQRPDQYVNGTSAWNLAAPQGAAPNAPAVPTPQPAALEERTMEIWVTPHGFLKAAVANNATVQEADGGSNVSFTTNGRNYTGRINAQNQVERVETTIDNPVLGDTPVEIAYSEYKDFGGGVMFPSRIVRTQGGHPVLDLTVTAVKPNLAADIAVPTAVSNAAVAPPTATVERLAPGVFYVKGGTHHSVAIDQRDHIVVVEAPQNEERSLAVIAKVKETIPNKPIRYVINTHHHFDHSGGLRTYVDEGATVVTHQMNQPYYEQAWAAPRTINPDRLAQSKKAAMFETFADKHVLTDGKRSIEIYQLAGSGHNDAFAMIYLPTERILIEGDAYTPTAADAPPPTAPNPFSVNLFENIQRLKLNVRQIAALHGPRLATMADLRTAIGQPAGATN
jgi:glyoxylase-like metal-dependent hydrolase (beta-lactamase superfamily II)